MPCGWLHYAVRLNLAVRRHLEVPVNRLVSATILCALIFASSLANASDDSDFSLKGIRLDEPKSSLVSAAEFDCNPFTEQPNVDELCTAHSTIGQFPALFLVYLFHGRVESAMAVHKSQSDSLLFAEVSKAAERKYGLPTKTTETSNGPLLEWLGVDCRFTIIHGSAGGVVIALTKVKVTSSIEDDI